MAKDKATAVRVGERLRAARELEQQAQEVNADVEKLVHASASKLGREKVCLQVHARTREVSVLLTGFTAAGDEATIVLSLSTTRRFVGWINKYVGLTDGTESSGEASEETGVESPLTEGEEMEAAEQAYREDT